MFSFVVFPHEFCRVEDVFPAIDDDRGDCGLHTRCSTRLFRGEEPELYLRPVPVSWSPSDTVLFSNTWSLGRWSLMIFNHAIKSSSQFLSWGWKGNLYFLGNDRWLLVSLEKERRGPQTSWAFSRCLSNEKSRASFSFLFPKHSAAWSAILNESPIRITLN